MRGGSYLHENLSDVFLPRVYPQPACLMPSLSDHGPVQGYYCRQWPPFIYQDNPQANFGPQQYQQLRVQHSRILRENLCTASETREFQETNPGRAYDRNERIDGVLETFKLGHSIFNDSIESLKQHNTVGVRSTFCRILKTFFYREPFKRPVKKQHIS